MAVCVVSNIGIPAVVARAGIVWDQHLPIGETLAKTTEGFYTRRNQTKVFSAQDAHNCIARELLPPALGLTVVHHKIRVSEFSCCAEIEDAILQRAVKNERGVAERAIGHGDRRAADEIVHDFVPDQNAQRIGSRIVADSKRNHRLGVHNARGPPGCGTIAKPLETGGHRSAEYRPSVARPT